MKAVVPKVVDHDARRAQLAGAVWRIAADRGLGAASLREVAAEAGWSLGALRHYFASRDDLLLFAFSVAAEGGAARMARAGAGGGGPRAALRRMLLEGLPLDDERRTECRVWFAFVVHADGSAPLRAERERAYRLICDGLTTRLEGLTPPGLGARRAATLLWAAVDGIALQALSAPDAMTPGRQRAALDAQLELTLRR